MAQPVWNASTKYYSFLEKDNPKDKVEVEVGDAQDSSTLFPQVKIKRWDNEVNSSIRLKHDTIPGNITYSDDGTKITWIKKQGQREWKAIFYHRDDLDEGGFEFEIHIPQIPPVNFIEFTVNTKDLDWFYQPALTPEEISEGATRPDNVIGSYAVYHKTKGGMNRVDGMEYKVGKAFHVYRPHVVDANGNETWGVLELDEINGILKISVDQTWLDNAAYPVVVDPTFGYTSIGGSSLNSGSIVGGKFTLTENGDITQVSFYINEGTAGQAAGAAIYDDGGTGGEPGTKKAEDLGNVAITGASWRNVSFSVSLPAEDYWLAHWQQSARDYFFDATGGVSVLTSGETFETWPDPYPDITPGTRSVSIYATYTASGGGAVVEPTGRMTSNTFFWGP